MFPHGEISSGQMEQNEKSIQYGVNHLKKEIKHEQAGECQPSTIPEGYIIQDLGSIVEPEIGHDDYYKFCGVIKSEGTDEKNETKQPNKTLINNQKRNEKETNFNFSEKFKCIDCEKTFTVESSLQRHLKAHSKEKTHKCNDCDKAFSVISNLRTHQQLHSEVTPFKCNDCNKTFSLESNLRRHKRVHIGEKQFKCDECRKAFAWQSDLRNHKRFHSGKKPFKCGNCERTFSRKHHLAVHKKIHKKPLN